MNHCKQDINAKRKKFKNAFHKEKKKEKRKKKKETTQTHAHMQL